MQEEIKEILEFDFESQGERIEINEYERNILKDYITYLQEENTKLKELCDKYEEEHSTEFKIWKDERYQLLDYKSRNEKAIEYINHEIFKRTILVGVGTKKYTRNILDNVLNLLQGEQNE